VSHPADCRYDTVLVRVFPAFVKDPIVRGIPYPIASLRFLPLVLLLLFLAAVPTVVPASAQPVIALDTEGGTLPLSYLAGRLDDEELATLQALAPNVTFVTGLSDEEAIARAAEFQGADAHVLDEEFLAAATNLRWVQAWSAGVDSYLQLEGLRDNDRIVFTNMQGVHGPVIAEHVFAMLLSLTRNLPQLGEAQRAGTWDRSGIAEMGALAGRTIFVVGMGGIGSQVARRAHCFDMTVLATVRDPSGRELPEYVAELGGADDLDRFLSMADVVVVTLPLTDETRGLFDAEKFALMPAGSWFVNVGRGPIVVTDDLVEALASGHLAGAALDVTDPEPLPDGHPLWGMENVIVTPHVSSWAELTSERRWEILQANMQAFAAGEPLINVVDKQRGY
jgi:phosphoglycerate dehydrogenase-like enzyme